MRIAFIGKGGSGKTTLSAAFANYAAEKSLATIFIDADVNAHSWEALGFTSSGLHISDRGKELLAMLEPKRQELRSALGEVPFIGCLPPSVESQFLTLSSEQDPILDCFSQKSDRGFRLITTGTYEEEEVGASCFHVKLFSTQLLAHRILDTPKDRIIFDVTAGTDPVATSLCLAYDLHCVVVEPTLKGVSVFEDYLKALPVESNVVAIGNKIRNSSDRQFLVKHLPANSLTCSFEQSEDIKAFERGDNDGLIRFVARSQDCFSHIDTLLGCQVRDWGQYYLNIQAWFDRYCEKWYNDTYGVNIGELTRTSSEKLAGNVMKHSTLMGSEARKSDSTLTSPAQ